MQQTIGSKRLRLIENADFAVDLEYAEGFFILHLPYVKNFSKSVLKRMLVINQDLKDLAIACGFRGVFAAVPPTDGRINKLLKLLKYEPIGVSDGLIVYEYGG